MIKQSKLEALFFSGMVLVSFMGYSANVYAATDHNENIDSTVSIEDAIKGKPLQYAKKIDNKLNKKLSCPATKNYARYQRQRKKILI